MSEDDMCQAADGNPGGDGIALRAPQSGSGAEAELLAEIARIHSVLLDRMKRKYAGNCKCGNCHLVPTDVIMNAANIISYSLPKQQVKSQIEERSDEAEAEHRLDRLTHRDEAWMIVNEFDAGISEIEIDLEHLNNLKIAISQALSLSEAEGRRKERERCAKIAEASREQNISEAFRAATDEGRSMFDMAQATAAHIASAIRKEDPNAG